MKKIAIDARLSLYESMLKVRLVEERIRDLYPEGDMRCPTHFSIGQEAAAAGICAQLRREDYAISAHRSHAHYINKGGGLRPMFAELYGKAAGSASGKGGSMHLIDLEVNFLGCVPIVGSTIPIGVGAAFGSRLKGESAVAVAFFGDGAAETGVFHESLNFASVHRLPVLFVCENNLYSVLTPLEVRQPQGRQIAALAEAHGMPARMVDGQRVEEVYTVAGELLDHVRSGKGPAFIEAMTYRWLEHCGPLDDLHLGYRTAEELEGWKSRCPVTLHETMLLEEGILDPARRDALRERISAEIDDAVNFARSAPFPMREELSRYVYA